MPRAGRRKVRYALIGLGYISQVAMLPAFDGAARNSTVAALISGDRKKLDKLGRDYGVPHLVHYDEFDSLVRSGEVDALYIGLPNTLHRDFAIRAAAAGVHVLCDKPMAMTAADCRAMIAAAERGGVKLMIAYRLHFEPANIAAFRAMREGRLGDIRYFTAQFSQQVKPGNIRTQGKLGGGPLFDLGIYCVNAARHTYGAEPEEVVAIAAKCDGRRFRDVPESMQVLLRFPQDKLASFTCSLGAADASAFHVWGTEGSLRLEAAYEMKGEKTLRLMRANQDRPRIRTFPATNQFAPLMLHFSDCVVSGREPVPSGHEGLADIRVLEAIEKSAGSGKTVRIGGAKPTAARLEQMQPYNLPPFESPRLYRAEAPSG